MKSCNDTHIERIWAYIFRNSTALHGLDLRNSNRNLLHRIVFEAWNECPDVTVYLGFLSHHHLQKAIIPADTDLSVIPGQKHSIGVGSILEALGIETEPVTEEDLAYYKNMIANQKAAGALDAPLD